MKYLITFFFLLFVFCPEIKAQSTLNDDGSLWNIMSDTEKYFYMKGFFDGFETEFSDCASRTVEVRGVISRLRFDNDPVADRKKQENVMQVIDNIVRGNIKENTIHVTTQQNIINQMNIFYREVRNRKISIDDMVRLSVKKLKGIDISEDLLDKRRYAEDPKKYMEDLEKSMEEKSKKQK